MNFSNKNSWFDVEIPGLWPFSTSNEHCCIYRVPNQLRRMNPEAYTPQMLIIGPLHHSKKFAKTDIRYVDYINMERCKTKYLQEITDIYGAQLVAKFKKIIERDEQIIRASYAESTEWIKSEEFVEMILRDSVFILQFMMQFVMDFENRISKKKRDFLLDQPALVISIIYEDLMLLENQLPFALLTELFEPFFKDFRDKVLEYIRLHGKIRREVKFRHFTDLFRLVHVVTLGLPEEQQIHVRDPVIQSLPNADMLNCAGVDFVVNDTENDFSLAIEFEGRTLKMPCFKESNASEKIFRNVMALEQCHYPSAAFVCNYMDFLGLLIMTEEDVDVLRKKGIITNYLESDHGLAAPRMVNMVKGVVFTGSNYYSVAKQLNKHIKKRTTT